MPDDAPALTKGPKFLKKWAADIGDAIESRTPLAGIGISINEVDTGIVISVSDDGGTSSQEGDIPDNLEIVTGAVNGVPSTLGVITDGNGWQKIT